MNLFLTHQPHDTGYSSPQNVHCQANAQSKKSTSLQSRIRREYILKVTNVYVHIRKQRLHHATYNN